MSRAFVKEDDPTGGAAVLPDRAISPHPNLVTRRGLRLIEARVREFERLLAETSADAERARAARELRYWVARLGTARLENPPDSPEAVRFGTTVIVISEGGSETSYAIVGEDEAEPSAGRIAWTAPLARALLGGEVGEVCRLPKGDFGIVAIRPNAE